MATQATLTSPDKKFKTIVDVGSSEASQLQSKGWGIGDAGANVIQLNQALTQGGNVAPTATPAPIAAPVASPVAPTPTTTTQPTQPVQQPQPPVAPTAPVQPTQVAPVAPATGSIPFIPGLDDAQRQSINNLVASGRTFNQTDLNNWNYATNNAPVPNAAPVQVQQSQAAPTANVDLGIQDQTQMDTGDGSFDLSSFDTESADLGADPITAGLLKKYGVTPPSATGNPVQDYASTYNQVLSSMGLPDIKAQFIAVQKKYSDLQNELNDAISGVNDDPWLSEGVRVGQIKRLQDKYQGKLQILNDQQKLYDSMYQQGVQQAQYVANAAYQQQQFNSQQAFNVAELALKEQEARASLQSSKLRDKLAIAQEMRMRAADDSEDAQRTTTNSLNSLKTLADMFGGSIFDNLSPAERRKWEQNAKLPSGTLDHLGKTLDERNLALEAQKLQQSASGGLSPAQVQSTINQITGAFDNEPIVKNYNVIGEAKQFVQSLADKPTPTSTDDQGLIYAFAKAMDPNSAVKEGEYLTIQKYSQSMVESGWANAQRMAKNQAFLTPEARANMIATVNSKYAATKQGYDNLYSEYNRRIEDAKTGRVSGSLPSYGGAWETTPSTGTTLPALNKSYNSIDKLISERPEYQQYILNQAQQGKSEQDILRSLSSGQPITFNSGMGGTPTAQNVGSLSSRYESSGNPGVIGYDSTGGYSYGTYQLAHNNAKTFIDQSPYARDFQGLAFNSPQFQKKWKEVAARDPQGFERAQHDFIAKTHFQPQQQKLASIGVDVNTLSPTLRDVIWSTAVQHGPSTNIIANAFKALSKNKSATEADLVKKIYQERWGGGKNFASSTPEVRKSVYNRFFGKDGELATALSSLNYA